MWYMFVGAATMLVGVIVGASIMQVKKSTDIESGD